MKTINFTFLILLWLLGLIIIIFNDIFVSGKLYAIINIAGESIMFAVAFISMYYMYKIYADFKKEHQKT